ncbi:MAG TPA: type I glutamate--ammonia ligase [Lachnospiraceae bacterium]|nr:type I glutamate--ammonia ligase [Lachnospiraceae bacterium]
MAKYTRQDILSLIEEEDIEFIRLQFTDISGKLKNMATTIKQIDKILDGHYKFDCKAIDGFNGTGYEELFLVPDLDTFVIFPWRPQNGKVARFLCDVVKPDGTPFVGDSRYILKKVVKEARDMGFGFNAAIKNEFFLFDIGENGEPANSSGEKGGYFDVGPSDGGENARRDMVLYLSDMGIGVESSYHSDEGAQHVLDLGYTDPLKMADSIMTTRLVVRTVAKRHGFHATFMPKPRVNVKGSGAHYIFSMEKDGSNVFTDNTDKIGISRLGYHFMAGMLDHITGMMLITNPIVNSYKRLIPGYLAPVTAGWSSTNTSPLIRLTSIGSDGGRIVLRSPDGAANPYLVIALCLAAGLDGIKNQTEPPVCMDELPESEIRKADVLPRTLYEAVNLFANDQFVQDVLGQHISGHMIQAKDAEWNEYCKQVTLWETERYLSTI